MRLATVCGLVGVLFASLMSSVRADHAPARLEVEVLPEQPTAGEEVFFVARYRDPDPLTAVHEGCAFFGTEHEAHECGFRYFQNCMGPVGWPNDVVVNEMPAWLLVEMGAGPPVVFSYTYGTPGTFEVLVDLRAAEFAPPCDVAGVDGATATVRVDVR